MDVIEIKNEIEKKIALLEKMRIEIKSRAEQKAITIAEYDKELAVCIIKMKNGNAMNLNGEIIENPPATLMEKIARGVCWESRLRMETADGMYKSIISNIDSVQAELNGYQSINRHLDTF